MRSFFLVCLTVALRSSNAAELEREVVNFSVKKHKVLLKNGGLSPAAVRHDLGRPWTMLNQPLRLVTVGCVDDKRFIEHL